MKTQTTISLLVAAVLVLASVTAVAKGPGQDRGAQAQDRAQVERAQKDFDRDRLRDRDRITAPARDRDQERTHVPGNAKAGENRMYGSELMSVEERSQYREQLRLTESDPEARTKFMAQHREKMQARATQRGVRIKDVAETEEAE